MTHIPPQNALYWLITAIILAKTQRPKEFEEAMRAFWDALKKPE